MKTFVAKPHEVKRDWYVVDAKGKVLGRVASEVARRLRGKHKPEYTPHVDTGDYIVIINAADIVVTGAKFEDKKYYHHSQFPGGLKTASLKDKMAKDPTTVITRAVRGMLPVNKLRPARLARLKVYAGAEHNHAAQTPEKVEVK